MPTRKQRRRDQKLRRHDWEEVYVDADGNELDVDPAELEARRREAKEAARKATTGKPQQKGGTRGRVGREVPPPTWRRVFRRGAIFAPIMLVVVWLLGSKLGPVQKVIETVFLLVMFIPFSYLMDSLAYRTYLRRTGQLPPRQPRRRRGGPETGKS
jgi:Flp pilus assembly protein TadB